ncbi:uncharacterized protein SAPINGB_P003671 [Magnusiomyces paraingens]|uniref:Uncharacterized protein n=1 Tax=Magnusiomyces paraingens TaxID=2606893 RepID=A0A5E8BRE9_9ASCO|nr:uncharacterized protein SAPINGB_P003671 [Saprochaete ingens]VVT53631.1 unnamed protein product [Saprochaete ingens]
MISDQQLKNFRLDYIANKKIREDGLIKLPENRSDSEFVNIMSEIYYDSWDFTSFYVEYIQRTHRCNAYFKMKYLFQNPKLKKVKVDGESWFDKSSYSPEKFSQDVLTYWASFYRYASVGEYNLMTTFATECLKEPAKVCSIELSGTELFHADIPLFCKDYINDFVQGGNISMENRKVRFKDEVEICMYPPNDYALAYEVSYAEVFRGNYCRKSLGSLYGEKDLCHGNFTKFHEKSKFLDIGDFIKNWHMNVSNQCSSLKKDYTPKSILKKTRGTSYAPPSEFFPSYPIFISPSSSGRRHLQNYPALVQYSRMNACMGVRSPPPSILDYKPQYTLMENAEYMILSFNSLIKMEISEEGTSGWNDVDYVEDNSGLFFDLIKAQITLAKSKRKDDNIAGDNSGDELKIKSFDKETVKETQKAKESLVLQLNESMVEAFDYVEKTPTRDLMKEYKKTKKNVSIDVPIASTKKTKILKYEETLINEL